MDVGEILTGIFKTAFDIMLDKIDVGSTKTADYHGLFEGNKVFIAEVKSLEPIFPSVETGYKEGPAKMLSKSQARLARYQKRLTMHGNN